MPPQLPGVVKNLLIINVIFFLATYLMGESQMIDLLALHYPGSELFKPLQFATHFFMHGGIAHIFFNMFALIMFGSALETQWGPQRFLFYYFFCAFGAAALHLGYDFYEISRLEGMINAFAANPNYDTYWAFFNEVPLASFEKAGGANAQYAGAINQLSDALSANGQDVKNEGIRLMTEYVDFKKNTPVVGASGAIYGLLLAFGMQYPNVPLMIIFLPIPIKAKYFIPLLMLVELYLGVNQFSWDNIAHFAHLGGAVSGFLLILYWRKFGARW